MRIAIVGQPRAGKSTLFNALTRGNAPTGDFGGKSEPHLGVAHVPDQRLRRLAEMFAPRRVVHSEITYIDMPGPKPSEPAAQMFSGKALSHLQRADALLHVVRAFRNDAVPHVKGSVDWARDLEDTRFDILFADIALIDLRIEHIRQGMKGLRASERSDRLRDIENLQAVQKGIEAGVPLRAATLSEPQQRALRDAFLLSALPYLVVLNIGEDEIEKADDLQAELDRRVSGPAAGSAVVCGSLEMELAQMDEDEEREFRASLGLGESGLRRMIRLSYQVLGLISFLTVGDDEVRAWAISEGTPAARAAGRVHSDMERGFIRAEIVSFDDLDRLGSLAAARKAGALRLEGRDYAMADGDVVNFLFSV